MNRTMAAKLLAAVAAAMSLHAMAQTYPAKVVRIVTTEPGSGNDLVARLVTQGLTQTMGQQFIVENRGILAGEIVARAPNDGYTLLSYGSPLWISPLIRPMPYDALNDFTPIMLSVNTPNVLVVHPSLPVKSVGDLIAMARARPAQLNYGTASTGSTSHLAAELFKSVSKVNIVRVPYKGSGQSLTALVAGEVHMMFPNAGSIGPHARSGKVKALAVTSPQPSALAPGLPTLSASGLPGCESESPFGILAPARTPPAIITRLNQEMVKILQRPDVKERLFSAGIEVVASTPEQLGATMRAEITKWGKLIKELGIREESIQ